MSKVRILIGTSGWHYRHWRERVYPNKLPTSRWLEHYAQSFKTVELNNSFYRLPTEKAFLSWKEGTPPGFCFAVKVSRLITHMKKLRNTDEALANFLARARLLGGKLGPILYQLPPNLHRNDELLDEFASRLPGDLDHVFEFRHGSWFDPAVFAIMERRNVAFCVFDAPNRPCPVIATGSFAYLRFHGSAALYSSCYTDQELSDWADRLRKLAAGKRAVYVYFNNDANACAIYNALTLRRLLGDSAE